MLYHVTSAYKNSSASSLPTALIITRILSLIFIILKIIFVELPLSYFCLIAIFSENLDIFCQIPRDRSSALATRLHWHPLEISFFLSSFLPLSLHFLFSLNKSIFLHPTSFRKARIFRGSTNFCRAGKRIFGKSNERWKCFLLRRNRLTKLTQI